MGFTAGSVCQVYLVLSVIPAQEHGRLPSASVNKLMISHRISLKRISLWFLWLSRQDCTFAFGTVSLTIKSLSAILSNCVNHSISKAELSSKYSSFLAHIRFNAVILATKDFHIMKLMKFTKRIQPVQWTCTCKGPERSTQLFSGHCTS